jgi:hypothetical protein
MRIGIDVSQVIYEKTGVSEYLKNLVRELVDKDAKNQYVLFFSSLRGNLNFSDFNFRSSPKNVSIKRFKFPPTFLDFLWNKLHIIPIEWLIGNVDVFITSDWTEPPSNGKKATVLYDLIVYKKPSETDSKIVKTQRRKLEWVKKESDLIFCISHATKKDAKDILEIDEKRLKIAYPGI